MQGKFCEGYSTILSEMYKSQYPRSTLFTTGIIILCLFLELDSFHS